jgi:hypothetical protein
MKFLLAKRWLNIVKIEFACKYVLEIHIGTPRIVYYCIGVAALSMVYSAELLLIAGVDTILKDSLRLTPNLIARTA